MEVKTTVNMIMSRSGRGALRSRLVTMVGTVVDIAKSVCFGYIPTYKRSSSEQC